MKNKLLIGAGILLAVWMTGFLVLIVFRPITVVPRLELAPGFSLVDQRGERLTSEDMRGSVALYTIGYTGCRTRCFPTDSILAAVQGRLDEAEAGEVPVRLVSISPYVGSHTSLDPLIGGGGTDGEVRSFATAEPEALRTLLGSGFGLSYVRQGDGQISYDPAFLLVDGNGLLRRRYRIGLPTVDKLLDDIRLVAREARASTGSARLAYEAAHLFACYSN